MAEIKVSSCKISDVIKEAENGQIKIPQFQRKYVWAVKDCAKLLDSIIKGYPVGALIYWKTKERLRSVRNVGNFLFPDAPTDDYTFYILDGQQRITSIIASIKGEKIGEDDYSQICVNLLASEEEAIVTTETKDLDPSDYISLQDLFEGDLAAIVAKYRESTKINVISGYINRLRGYEFSKVELTDATLDIATEVFTRINTSGKSLSIFEIMCAKMYSERPAFDLYEKRLEQRQKWELASFETIPDTTVLQAASVCICKDARGKAILQLDKQKFIDLWDDLNKAFDLTIDYFKNTYNVPVSKLVPYDALIVPFVYYFYHKKERPSGAAQKWLKDYFWRSTYSLRFTEGAISKINQDITNVIDKILNGKKPEYEQGLVITRDTIQRNGVFSVGSAYIKGLLCILASKKPKSFLDGHEVTIDNSWLSQGNSKNYHHFFPKDYMKKNRPLTNENFVNHIVNITIVDGWLNKGKIKSKAPSIYMKEFKEANAHISEHMKSHLINDLDEFGVFEDNYDRFFECRIEAIHSEMISRIEAQDNDELRFDPSLEED